MSKLARITLARFAVVLFALALTAGCDGFTGDKPMERFGTVEHELDRLLDQPTALGVVALVNDPATDLQFLDQGLALDVRAAERIVGHRQGPDGVDGTEDDDLFENLFELDEIGYVGDAALLALADAAWELDYVPAMVLEGVSFTAGSARAVLLLGNAGTLDEIDDGAALDVRAAQAIVAGRPYLHLGEIAERPHVGPSALLALQAYAQDWTE
ncbi:MAG: hypothetical protein KDA24_23630 [Deltaproteobacteria bacterium]|nr:hypothetical protein [Deltaproteobacteria bacterium]